MSTPMYRARRSEARIQQMLWKVNHSDIVFLNAVRVHVVCSLIYRDTHYALLRKSVHQSRLSISYRKWVVAYLVCGLQTGRRLSAADWAMVCPIAAPRVLLSVSAANECLLFRAPRQITISSYRPLESLSNSPRNDRSCSSFV